jgi:hypothetical protein
LSNCPDTTIYELDNGVSCGTNMFQTKSLYDLMKNVFVPPNKDNAVYILSRDDHFTPLARILSALSGFAQTITKSAPMIILDVDDKRMTSVTPEQDLATILQEIWEAGERKSIDSAQYGCSSYGLRLTDSGHVFAKDIQPSFSFIAAQYCSEEAPLFYLRDVERIKYVIKTVFDSVQKLCRQYENAVHGFCEDYSTLIESDSPLLYKHEEKSITFRERICNLHKKHLVLYEDFVEKNWNAIGLDKNQKLQLTKVHTDKKRVIHKRGYIYDYIEKYDELNKRVGI